MKCKYNDFNIRVCSLEIIFLNYFNFRVSVCDNTILTLLLSDLDLIFLSLMTPHSGNRFGRYKWQEGFIGGTLVGE